MELPSIKYPMVWFLLVLTVTTVIGTKFAIKIVEYQQTKNVEFNFTRFDLGKKLTRIQCSRICSEDSHCLGVVIQEITMVELRCFKMMNDSSGDTIHPDELVYIKGNKVTGYN